MQIHIGCSGWFYWHWRGIFYPDKRTDIYFDNDREGFAVKNAQELRRQVRKRGLEVV